VHPLEAREPGLDRCEQRVLVPELLGFVLDLLGFALELFRRRLCSILGCSTQGFCPTPIRKEVRSGCCSEHLSNPTPGGASRAASSADGSHRELVRSGGWSGRPPGGGRPASCGRSNLTPLGPGFLNIRQRQLPAGEDDSPARSVAETNPLVAWPNGVDVAHAPAHRSAAGPCRSHQLLHSDAGSA
jgi:hypothetical protein